jgi:hypothetical protein
LTLPTIIINYRKETATNSDTGAACDIIHKCGTWYTNSAGLIALEKGVLKPENLRAILSMGKSRDSARFNELLKPLNFNDTWLYSILGWVEYRKGLVKLPKVGS